MNVKRKILNPELAKLAATLVHGDMLCIEDASAPYEWNAIYPLDEKVQVMDLGVVSGTPTVEDIIEALVEVVDFECAILPAGFDDPDDPDSVPEFFDFIADQLGGKEYLNTLNYAPEWFLLRNRCKAFIKTGDYVPGHCVILSVGWPSAERELEILR